MGLEIGVQGLLGHRLPRPAYTAPLALCRDKPLQPIDHTFIKPDRERDAPNLRLIQLDGQNNRQALLSLRLRLRRLRWCACGWWRRLRDGLAYRRQACYRRRIELGQHWAPSCASLLRWARRVGRG